MRSFLILIFGFILFITSLMALVDKAERETKKWERLSSQTNFKFYKSQPVQSIKRINRTTLVISFANGGQLHIKGNNLKTKHINYTP